MSTTSRDKTYYYGGYENTPNRVLPGDAARVLADSAL